MTARFPRISVHTDLQDAHLYIFKRWVLDMLVDKENITSISEDLIPMLVKCQYQRKMVEREKVNECKSIRKGKKDGLTSNLFLSCEDAKANKTLLSTALSLSTTSSDDIEDDVFSANPVHPAFKSPVKTLVHVYRQGFCGRGNTIASYCELNRHVRKKRKDDGYILLTFIP